jgi:large subunit ribosomal protein L5
MNRLKDHYKNTLAKELATSLGLKNPNQVPKIEKIVVSVGVGRALQDSKHLEQAMATLTKVTGQKPVVTKARKSIATFKLREGNEIGATVTLRGERMYYFLDQLVSVVLPRIRDFHGVKANAFDPQGNYSIGIKEQTVFPQISYEEAHTTHGMQINIITSGRDKEAAKALLTGLGMPFEKGAN